eukprot:scaffold269168_cov31-Tisochrysis_lutea.AAC.2
MAASDNSAKCKIGTIDNTPNNTGQQVLMLAWAGAARWLRTCGAGLRLRARSEARSKRGMGDGACLENTAL